jgi:hypothetical protein
MSGLLQEFFFENEGLRSKVKQYETNLKWSHKPWIDSTAAALNFLAVVRQARKREEIT